MRRFLSCVLALNLTLIGTSPALADKVSNSLPDRSTMAGVPLNFDIDFIGYQEFSSSPNFHVFVIWMKGPIGAAQFNDQEASWAMVEIDSDSDGVANFRVETTKASLSGRFGSAAKAFSMQAGKWVESTTCSPTFYGDIDAGGEWIGIRVPYTCFSLPQNFGMIGYSEYRQNGNKYFDWSHDSVGEFFQTSHSFSASSPSNPGTERPKTDGTSGFRVESPSQAPPALEQLSPKVLESVVTIFCRGALGSGWSARVQLPSSQITSGYKSFIVTNHHVIEDCLANKTVTLTRSDGSSHVGQIVSWDATNDLAGIVTTAAIPGLTWQGQTPSQGWWVGVLGAPRGITGYLTTGLISVISRDQSEIGTTAPVNPGNSGGPIFDRVGRVIGTVSWKLRESEGLGFAKSTPLLCLAIIDCQGSSNVWTNTPQTNPDSGSGVTPVPKEPTSEVNISAEVIDSSPGRWTVKVLNATGSKVSVKANNRWFKYTAKTNNHSYSQKSKKGTRLTISVWVDGSLYDSRTIRIR
jgi:S1-C subfamily serine protease